MTAKYDDFMVALEDLCRRHQVQILVDDYEGLQIRDLDNHDEIIDSFGLHDMTEGSEDLARIRSAEKKWGFAE